MRAPTSEWVCACGEVNPPEAGKLRTSGAVGGTGPFSGCGLKRDPTPLGPAGDGFSPAGAIGANEVSYKGSRKPHERSGS